MKCTLFFIAMFIGIFVASAQNVPEKSYAELKNEGNAAVKAKDYPKALNLYEQAISKLGDTPIPDTTLVFNMGQIAFMSKNYEKALKYFDQSISLGNMKVNSFLSKSDVMKTLKKDDECVAAMEAAFAIAPKDPKVKSKLAGYYAKEASTIYAKGGGILNKVNAQVSAGKMKPSDEPYKKALTDATEEFKKAMPLIDKALEYDETNATAKQLKAACEQALK